MAEISFQQIRQVNGAPWESFEELCCQIFYRTFRKKLAPEAKYQRFQGSGGDGGVEAIFVMSATSELGVQSKYFSKLGSSEFKQMEDSLKSAVKNHPELKSYIYCLPFDLTSRRAGGTRGKSQTEKFNDWKQAQQNRLTNEGHKLDIELWTESYLRDRLIEIDPNGGLRRYWFDKQILTDDWLSTRLQEAKYQAGKRYTPELSIEVPAMDALEYFGNPEYWQKMAADIRKKATDLVEKWNSAFEKPEGCPLIIPDITEELVSLRKSLEVATISESTTTGTIEDLCVRAGQLLEKLNKLEPELRELYIKKHGNNADTPGYRQFMAEFQVSFPAEKLDTSRKTIVALQELKNWLSSPQVILHFSQFMLLRGVAGIGKTHAIVDHGLYRFRNNQLSLVFFGEDFNGPEPWEVMASKLGIGGNIGRDELWGMIDSAAVATGYPAVVYIDALNESIQCTRWKQSWLAGLRQQLSHYPNIKLCISCRDTYLDEVINDRKKWPEFIHNGFYGKEFEAIREFFEFYKIQPPETPLLQPEFSNPLFLHLICQGLNSEEIKSLPLGSTGFSDILRLLIEEKNRHIAKACRYDPNEDKVSQALNSLASIMADENTRILPYNRAKSIVNKIFPTDDHSRSLFANLEKEGLIAFFERQSRPLSPKERFCRFTFERIADFLIANHILNEIKEEGLPTAFSNGKLSFLVKSNETAREHRGLLEALSLIIPERFGYELIGLSPNVDSDILLPIIFSGFQWRDKETFTSRTINLIYKGFSDHKTIQNAYDALLGIALIPKHPCNAKFIDSLLKRNKLTERDAFWSYVLYQDYENRNAGWRLIEWSLHADLSGFCAETCLLWALILSWFCAASDRRVRDRATKGLVKVFQASPQIVPIVLTHFMDTDDDYVLERVSLSVYSAILLCDDDKLLASVVPGILWIFEEGTISQNALIRDTFRLILEQAFCRRLLSCSTDPSIFRPPYNSKWPLEIPDEKEIKILLEKEFFGLNMRLSTDELGTDFQRYKLENRILEKFDLESVSLSKKQIFHWFIKSTNDLGYPGPDEQCYNYDRFITGKYGPGRAKPVWAERLGKKYYWILARRLQGILSDHVKPKLNGWEEIPETMLAPLQGINLRDIDPTDLRPQEEKVSWWSPNLYDFRKTQRQSHEEWIAKDDFPNIVDSLEVPGENGELWIPIQYNWSPEWGMGINPDDRYPYRDLTTIVKTAFIPKKDIKSVTKKIVSEKFAPWPAQYTPREYRLYLGEYPNSITCNHQFETNELQNNCEIPGTDQATITNCSLLRGDEWEYDCSQYDAPNIEVPSPKLIDYGKLKLEGLTKWVDRNSITQIVPVVGMHGNGLLVRKSFLNDFLQNHSLILIFIVYQRKVVVSGTFGGNRPGQHERRAVYQYDGKKITKISLFSEIR